MNWTVSDFEITDQIVAKLKKNNAMLKDFDDFIVTTEKS